MRKVLVIGYVWPEPQSSAAGLRDQNLVDIFQNAGWDITFVSPSKPSIHSDRLAAQGIKVLSFAANDSAFDRFIADHSPDIVIFDRFVIEEMFGWRVKEFSPRTMRVLDLQDLHFLRHSREKAVLEKSEFDLCSNETYREIASIYRSDLTLTLSQAEMDLLVDRFLVPKSLLGISRFCYPTQPSLPPFEARKDFIFIGNFRHPPNPDGIRWLKNEIWPLIRESFPGSAPQVDIYGAYPPKETMVLHHPEAGFHIRGFVENVNEVMSQHRVNLAPIRFGAGIKGKITDGWWSGTPAIATSIAAEGLNIGESGRFGGLISDVPVLFARFAVELYSDPVLWKKCQETGSKIMRNFFHFESNGIHLLNLLNSLHKNLNDHRKANFVGEMLWHHSVQSMRYLSKWIEEKNKNRFPKSFNLNEDT